MTPGEVLQQWFAAHSRGDEDAARRLVAPDVDVVVPGAHLVGFDALMSWYRDRAAAEGPGFGYEVVDVLAGQHHAAAVLHLRSAGRQWRQVAVYSVSGDTITSIWAAEEGR